MHVIVVGAGRIGSHLVKILLEEGTDVSVIDKDGDTCHEVAVELECPVVRGDATKPRVLEEAGIHEADTLVALTGSDETNLVICLMAKQLGAKHVGVRLGALHYEEEVLKKLGIDLVIYPEAAAAGYISELITKPEVLDLAFIARGNAEIVEAEVKANSRMVNKKISEIEHPQGTSIIALVEEGKIVIPDGDTTIKAGDKVLVLAKTDKIKDIKRLLGL